MSREMDIAAFWTPAVSELIVSKTTNLDQIILIRSSQVTQSLGKKMAINESVVFVQEGSHDSGS